MKNTKIEWCDHTFNPWEGCTKVSPGCANCYAENRNARFGGGKAPNWGKGAPRRRTSASNWAQPIKWDKDAALSRAAYESEDLTHAPYRRPRVFCASLADIFDDEVPIEWFADAVDLAWRTPNLDWLWLTKRPENFRRRLQAVEEVCSRDFEALKGWQCGYAPSNIWIGTTVEDQQRAEERIPYLLQIPARVRFLSCEPLLGHVFLDGLKDGKDGYYYSALTGAYKWDRKDIDPPLNWPGKIDWVICGGESGPGARPMHPEWARSLRDQCKDAGVPFLFKQWGEWAPYNSGRDDVSKLVNPTALDTPLIHVGKKAAGRLLDGVEHNEFPGA